MSFATLDPLIQQIARDQLTAKQYVVFVDRMNGHSWQTIADAHAIDEGTARGHWRRAVRRIRRHRQSRMSESTIIDISAETNAICTKLELTPDTVASITITPGDLKASVYELNENGEKYIRDDAKAAMYEKLEFKVRT